MAYNQQLSVLGQVAPATTGTAGQVLVSAGSSASSYWASAIPVSAYSGQFNGSQSLSMLTGTQFGYGTGDFTIEFWINLNSLPAAMTLFSHLTSAASVLPHISYTTTLNYYNGANRITGASLSINTWYHIAAVRISGSTKLYLNGTQTGSTYADSNDYGTTAPVAIANYYSSYPTLYTAERPAGYISNIRVVKGLGVYTGTFTPPTSPLGTAQAAGTNISAVTPSQVSLLTCNAPGFIDSSPNAAVITNNGAVVSSQYAPFSSFSAISRSATQTQTILTSGSGTYYPPSGVAWLRIRMVGGGGGAGGGGTGGANYGGAGSPGTNTTFGSSLLTATSGGGADNSNGPGLAGGAGGTGTINTGATGIVIAGGRGSPGTFVNYATGGTGGSSPFGGAGVGYPPGSASGGTAGSTNSGSGGGGSGAPYASISFAGHGGGAGGYIEAYISTPAASYAYTIGAGGGGGAGGTYGAGGGGGSGIIIVEENYAVNVTSGSYTASYLVVAGGGGGSDPNGGSGGGGAGGLVTGSTLLTSGQTYTITVGSGGAGLVGLGISGMNSSITGLTTAIAVGGGYGSNGSQPGGNGGSGGGGSYAFAAGFGTSGQGNPGGTGTGAGGSGNYGGGGGGGASAAGGNGTSSTGGAGGAGTASSITGSSVTYAGGGGGGTYNGGTAGTGGAGGGGAGGGGPTAAVRGTNGTTNTGGGGGGGGSYNGGGNGGSGVVIISLPSANYTGTVTGSPTVTTNGIYTVLKFTTSGTYTA